MASGGTRSKISGWQVPKGSPPYLVAAIKDIGTKEWIVNSKRKRVSNPYVEEMAKKVTGQKMNAITVPWCAYWIGAKFEDAGIPSTKSGMARSYLKWGTAIDHKDPSQWKPGDVMVFWRGTHNDGVTGHVNMFLYRKGNKFVCVGGNQGDEVSVEEFSSGKLLGVRRPRAITQSRTVRSAGGAAVSEVAKETVKAAVPDSSKTMLPSPDAVNGTLEQVKGPLEQLATYKPWILGILSVITLICVAYTVYYRWSDWKEGR